MRTRKRSLRFALCAATLSLSFSALAHGYRHDHCPHCPAPAPEDQFVQGFIVGVQAGYGRTNWSDINQNAFANTNVVVSEDYGAAGRAFVGYVTNKYIGYELGYTRFHDATIQQWNAFGYTNYPLTKIDNWALDASVRLSAPIYGNAGFFATFGVAYLYSDNTVRWNGDLVLPIGTTPNTQHVASYCTTYGFGAYRDISCNWRVEVVWKHFEGNSVTDDLYQPAPDLYAIGLVYRI